MYIRYAPKSADCSICDMPPLSDDILQSASPPNSQLPAQLGNSRAHQALQLGTVLLWTASCGERSNDE